MMIYNREVPPSVVYTWIQLRGLAWDRMETPQVSMAQLSDLTGKSQSTLYAHMALLRSWGALRMRPSVKGSIIVAFPADTGEFFLDGNSLPAQLANRNMDSEKLAASPKRSKRAEGEQDPVKIYQTLTGIRPNKPQRQQLKDQVHDSALWSATVEHWQSHGWNPKNIAGILDIYQRGGPAACLCARRKADSRDGSVSALNQLREEFK
jgi:hypothetical protein